MTPSATLNRRRLLSLFGLITALSVIYATRGALGASLPRVAYAVAHLPAALLAIAAALAVLLLGLPTPPSVLERTSWRAPVGVAAVFCSFWIPPWLAGGWIQDDWRLLAAASIRRVAELHPSVSLAMLDSVDGNYRPLSTVLFFSAMLHWFGAAEHAFTAAPLMMTLLSGMVAYAIVRELGYSAIAAATASALFFSRGMLYTVATWTAALGDGVAICLCGLTALLVLRACRSRSSMAVPLHAAAWLCLTVATLAKQSSFVTPLIVALILLVRPGQSFACSRSRRIATSAGGLLLYALPVVTVFLRARALTSSPSPYPIGVSAAGILRLFSYLTWYFAVVQLPDRLGGTAVVSSVTGILLAALFAYLIRRYPQLLGERPRDVWFALLAAAASLSILVVLQTRAAPYYGCMFSFWLSIALGILLTHCWSADPLRSGRAARVCWCAFMALLLTGFAEVRLAQIGLIASGGYTWGAYSAEADRRFDQYVRQQLAMAPTARTALFQDCRDHGTPSAMVLLAAPRIQRILLYDETSHTYFVNDRKGERPVDDLPGRTDTAAYNWTVPMDSAAAEAMLDGPDVVRIPCVNGFYPPGSMGR